MGKVLEKLKKEVERIEAKEKSRGDYTKVDWFKPEKGDNIIRVLPHWSKPDDSLFYKTINIHYGLPISRDGKTYKIPARCLRDLNEDCPLCDEYEKLGKGEGKDLRSSERAIFNIIDFKTQTVKPWQCPETVYKYIFAMSTEMDEDTWDLKTGRNWKIRKKVDPSKPPQFGTKYEVFPDMKQSAVPKKLLGLTEDLPDLDGVYCENHREAMLDLLGLEEKSEDVDDDNEKEEVFTEKPVKKHKKKAKAEVDEEDEDEEENDEEVFTEKPVKKHKKKAKAEVDEEDEEEGEDDNIVASVKIEDKELEDELRRLGV